MITRAQHQSAGTGSRIRRRCPCRVLEKQLSCNDPGNHPSLFGRSTVMPARGVIGVGRFHVELEVANYGDLALTQRGLMPPDQVRREKIQGMVDTGAMQLVLPEAVVKRLGLTLGEPVQVRYADGRKARRRRVTGVSVQLLGRDGVFTAIREPKREKRARGSDRARGPRPAGRLRDPEGHPPRSKRRNLRDRMNPRFRIARRSSQVPEAGPAAPEGPSSTAIMDVAWVADH